MKKILCHAWLFTIILSFLVGCGKAPTDELNTQAQSTSIESTMTQFEGAATPIEEAANPFEEAENPFAGTSSIGHGLVNPVINENGQKSALKYSGGEMSIDYHVKGSGKGKNVGIFLFIDGMPQPYKINNTEADYEYLHIFDIPEDNGEIPFSFIFSPVTGKSGETKTLTFVSIYYPAFQPDMKETVGYGMYHAVLEYTNEVNFESDAAPLTEAPAVTAAITSASLNQKAVTNDLYKELSSAMFEVTPVNYESNIFARIFYDGDSNETDNLQVDSNGLLNVTYALSGQPNTAFRTTFYVNHQPIASTDGISFDMTIGKGDYPVLDITIDTGKLGEFNTFYAISVPTDGSDGFVQKTPSILLYK